MNGELGSMERTATVRSAARRRPTIALMSVDLPAPGAPVMPTMAALPVRGVDLADELPAAGVVVLDERDAARERAAVAVEQALRE